MYDFIEKKKKKRKLLKLKFIVLFDLKNKLDKNIDVLFFKSNSNMLISISNRLLV